MAIDIQCCRKAGLKTVAAIFLAVAGCALPARPDTNDLFAARARAEFETAKIRYQSLTNDPAAAWHMRPHPSAEEIPPRSGCAGTTGTGRPKGPRGGDIRP